MAKNGLDKTAAASAVAEIRRARRERLEASRARRHGNTSKALGAELLRQKALDKARAAPAVVRTAGGCEVRHTRERGHGITYERKAVLCGKKGCEKLHGPYWYAFWTAGGRVRSVYIGKKFQTVESKCPERL